MSAKESKIKDIIEAILINIGLESLHSAADGKSPQSKPLRTKSLVNTPH